MTPDEWRANTDGLINKIRDYATSYGDRVRFVPLKVGSLLDSFLYSTFNWSWKLKITGLCSPTMLERMSSLI